MPISKIWSNAHFHNAHFQPPVISSAEMHSLKLSLLDKFKEWWRANFIAHERFDFYERGELLLLMNVSLVYFFHSCHIKLEVFTGLSYESLLLRERRGQKVALEVNTHSYSWVPWGTIFPTSMLTRHFLRACLLAFFYATLYHKLC